MTGEGKRRNLGRGLSALLGEDAPDYTELDKVRIARMMPIEHIHPGRYQPRHGMDEEQIENLAQSIREKGILQPLVVRPHPDEPDAYEIIAGERRWRAAQLARLHEVPVMIKDLSDSEALEIALVENLQRQDLSPLEEAEGYRRLMDEFSHTQENLAKALGKSRSHVANTLRLLALPEPVKEMLDDGRLTAGHARALLIVPDPEGTAKQVVRRGLNVRQTERLAKQAAKPGKAHPHVPPVKDPDTVALERDLATLLGLRVEIKFREGGGSLTIHYSSLDQLDDILHRLSHGHRGGPAPALAAGRAAEAAAADPANDVEAADAEAVVADLAVEESVVVEPAVEEPETEEPAGEEPAADAPLGAPEVPEDDAVLSLDESMVSDEDVVAPEEAAAAPTDGTAEPQPGTGAEPEPEWESDEEKPRDDLT